MNGSRPKTGTGRVASSYPDWDVQALLEQIWNHLGGTVSRSTIRQVLAEVIPNYENARVQTFVPIFVHKETVKRLRVGLAEVPPDNTPEPAEGIPTLPGKYGQVGGSKRAESPGTIILTGRLRAGLALLRMTLTKT
jgi:hypothetical protein